MTKWVRCPKSSKPKEPHKTKIIDHPDYIHEIGLIAIETVELEVKLTALFTAMLMLPPRVGRAIVSTPKNHTTKVDIIREAARAAFAKNPLSAPTECEKRKTEILPKIEKILNKAQGAFNDRNRALHDLWGVYVDSGEVHTRRIDVPIGKEPKVVTLSDLKKQVEKTRSLIDDIVALTAELRGHPPLMVYMRKSTTKSG